MRRVVPRLYGPPLNRVNRRSRAGRIHTTLGRPSPARSYLSSPAHRRLRVIMAIRDYIEQPAAPSSPNASSSCPSTPRSPPQAGSSHRQDYYSPNSIKRARPTGSAVTGAGRREREQRVSECDAASAIATAVGVLERQCQLFLPWLTLQDRFSLGLTSKSFLYNHDTSIKEIALRAPPAFYSADASSSVQSVSSARLGLVPRLGIRFNKLITLHVRDSSAIPVVLTVFANHGWPCLRTLCCKRLRMGSVEVSELARLMEEGRLKCLTSLDLSDCLSLDADCITSLAEVLATGRNCPSLVDLNLRGTGQQRLQPPPQDETTMDQQHAGGEDSSGAVRVALEFLGVALQGRRAQGCRPVQRLHLACSCMQFMGRLMSPETLVGLKELDLADASLTEAELLELGNGLRNSRAPQLEVLRVGGGSLVPESGRSLANALLCGGAPRLRVLALEAVGMGGNRAMGALVAAVELGACSTLKELTMAKAGLGAGDVEALMQAAQQRRRRGSSGGPEHLKVISFNRNRAVGPRGGAAIAYAIANGAFPVLEVLNLQDTNIGDVGMTELSSALAAGGAGHRIKKLLLGSCDIYTAGAGAIARMLSAGACPRLETLALSLNCLGPAGVSLLADALGNMSGPDGGSILPRLKVLELNFVDMGDAGALALKSALCQSRGALPDLDRVEVLQWGWKEQQQQHHHPGGPPIGSRAASDKMVGDLRATLLRRKTTNSHGWPVYVVC